MDRPESPPSMAQPPDFPRFGIRHMLLWAVCVAVVMPVDKYNYSVPSSMAESTALLRTIWIITAIQQSAEMMALAILVSRRWRGLRFPEHPGERYWLIRAIMVVVSMIHLAGLRAGLWRISTLLLVSPPLLSSALLLHAAWRVGPGSWRWLFGINAATTVYGLMPLLVDFLAQALSYRILDFFEWFARSDSFFRMTCLLPPILAGLVCVVLDHRRGRRYPWTHWWGVGLLLAGALQLLWAFVLR